MDDPKNTSPNPKLLTAASWLMIVVGILMLVRGGINVVYCVDADRLRTIAGMLVPAILLIIGGIIVERAERYREASERATAMMTLAIVAGMLLKVQTAPDALQKNAALYSAWDAILFVAMILASTVWIGLRILTIRNEKDQQDDEEDIE